jgi:hypothetical protein
VQAAVVTAEVLEKRQMLSTVGLWHFRESSGTTTADSSGSGNTATLAGAATFASGHSGNALSLYGSTEADVANSASLNTRPHSSPLPHG